MTALLKDSGGHRRQTPSKNPVNSKTRDFFKLAANMANPSIKMSLNNQIDLSIKSQVQDRILISPFLDPTYQKFMLNFNVIPEENNHAQLQIIELASEELTNNQVLSLHKTLLECFEQNPSRVFQFVDHRGASPREIIISHGSLFWANRLKNKSWQTNAGVEPGLKYFHANLCSVHPTVTEIDLIYWLRFDEQQEAVNGSFVNL